MFKEQIDSVGTLDSSVILQNAWQKVQPDIPADIGVADGLTAAKLGWSSFSCANAPAGCGYFKGDMQRYITKFMKSTF